MQKSNKIKNNDIISGILSRYRPVPDGPTMTSRRALRDYLFARLPPQCRNSRDVILVALNDYTRKYQDPLYPLQITDMLSIVRNDDSVLENMTPYDDLILSNRKRHEEIVIIEQPVENENLTLVIGSIHNRCYMTVVIIESAMDSKTKSILHNELYEYNRFIQAAYDPLYPFWEGRLS